MNSWWAVPKAPFRLNGTISSRYIGASCVAKPNEFVKNTQGKHINCSIYTSILILSCYHNICIFRTNINTYQYSHSFITTPHWTLCQLWTSVSSKIISTPTNTLIVSSPQHTSTVYLLLTSSIFRTNINTYQYSHSFITTPHLNSMLAVNFCIFRNNINTYQYTHSFITTPHLNSMPAFSNTLLVSLQWILAIHKERTTVDASNKSTNHKQCNRVGDYTAHWEDGTNERRNTSNQHSSFPV